MIDLPELDPGLWVKGTGSKNRHDDDGLVGVNSQQIGDRLKYTECFACDDCVTQDTSPGYLADVNSPTSAR